MSKETTNAESPASMHNPTSPVGMMHHSIPAIPIINPAKVPNKIESDIAPAVGAPFRQALTRRSMFMNMAVSALTGTAIAPSARAATMATGSDAIDPIFGAITAVKAAQQIYDAAFAEQRKVETTVPKDIDVNFFCGEIYFNAGCYNGNALRVSSEEELNDTLVKRYMALLVDGGHVRDGKIDDVAAERPEKVWFDIEIKQVYKAWEKMKEMHERGSAWREKSGYNQVEEAVEDAEEALTDAQRALVRTLPTTAAGLIALLEYFEEYGLPYGVDDWQGEVLPTIADAARKFLRV